MDDLRIPPIQIGQPVFLSLPPMLPAKKFEEIFGVTVKAIEGKIRRDTWKEGREFLRDPDKKIHVILEGYYKWLTKNLPKHLEPGLGQKTESSLLTLGGAANDTDRQLTSSRQSKASMPLRKSEVRL